MIEILKGILLIIFCWYMIIWIVGTIYLSIKYKETPLFIFIAGVIWPYWVYKGRKERGEL